jgi:hypothetical protein
MFFSSLSIRKGDILKEVLMEPDDVLLPGDGFLGGITAPIHE